MENLHTHTVFSDGKNTPEEMVEAALRLGLERLGFSDHSCSPQTEDAYACGMKMEDYPRYQQEIHRLQEKYAGRLEILCGLEQDLDSPPPPEGFDYLIGSVHLLSPNGHWFSVDESPEAFRRALEEDYGGDPYALCEDYYQAEIRLADLPCDIIGHFDLVTKFNENNAFFDENHPRYQAARKAALDVLLKTGRPFEVNTGAISRGWRKSPYLSSGAAEYIRQQGGRLLLSSDSHATDTLICGFREWQFLVNETVWKK